MWRRFCRWSTSGRAPRWWWRSWLRDPLDPYPQIAGWYRPFVLGLIRMGVIYAPEGSLFEDHRVQWPWRWFVTLSVASVVAAGPIGPLTWELRRRDYWYA